MYIQNHINQKQTVPTAVFTYAKIKLSLRLDTFLVSLVTILVNHSPVAIPAIRNTNVPIYIPRVIFAIFLKN